MDKNYKFDLDNLKNGKMGILDIWGRHFNIFNLSLVHAFTALTLCSIGFVIGAPTWNIFEWTDDSPNGYFIIPNPKFLNFAYTVSCIYFIYDTWCIFRDYNKRNAPLDLEAYGYLFHHVVCIWGLGYPVWMNVDAVLVGVGFIAGEMSNPPRGLSEFAEFELEAMRIKYREVGESEENWDKIGIKKSDAIKQYTDLFLYNLFLHDVYFVLFLILRFLSSVYVFTIILNHFQTYAAIFGGISVVLFSIASVFIILPGRSKRAEEYYTYYLPFPPKEQAETDKTK